MNKETFDACMTVADKMEAASKFATRAGRYLNQWAENIRRESTKHRSAAVWSETTDQPTESQKTADEAVDRVRKVAEDFLRRKGWDADRVTKYLNESFNRPSNPPE